MQDARLVPNVVPIDSFISTFYSCEILSLIPTENSPDRLQIGKDIVMVVDVSGSMSGVIPQVKQRSAFLKVSSGAENCYSSWCIFVPNG